MIRETDKKTWSWPGIITHKNFDLMIKLRLCKKVEKQYVWEIQFLCRIPSFGLAIKNISGTFISTIEEVDKHPLENIIKKVQKKVLLLNSMIIAIGLSSWRTSSISSVAYSWLVSMKIVTILIIFSCFAHQNNSNYIPLLIARYMYSAGAWLDAITFLNHLGLLISYGILL